MAKDLIGDEMPEGYEAWSCDVCTAVCNFEAMQMCIKRIDLSAECGFEKDLPESNHGMFGFIRKKDSNANR